MEQPFISIVIPAYNAAKTLPKTLEACLKQDYPQNRYEIIVVDDGSRDNTRSITESYTVRYIYQNNSGPAAARNNGCENAHGTIVAFLDSDCKPRTSWLRKMVRFYTSDEVVCVGSRYGIANRWNLLACCIYCEFLIRYKRMPRFPKFLGSHGYSFRKSFLQEIGGYSEEYRMASHEDNELVCRIVLKGHYPLFDKTNIVDHYFPTDFYRYMRIQFWHGYWRMKLYADHPRMVTGDDYSDIWDYMQPPLMLLSFILLFLCWIENVPWLLLASLITVFLLQLPISISIVRYTKKKRFFYYIPFGMIRALARSLGMVRGIIHFWILVPRKF